MSERAWSASLAAGLVATLGLVGEAVAQRPVDPTLATTPRCSRLAEPSPGVRGADRPVAARPETRTPEVDTESQSLPAPGDDIELPSPADIFVESVIEDSVVITLAPRPLRRPRHLP